MKTQEQYIKEFEKKVRELFNSSTLFSNSKITFTYKKKSRDKVGNG